MRADAALGALAQVLEVAQVFAGEQFGGENDLAGMLREMFHDVVDGFHQGSVVNLLDRFSFGEALHWQRADHAGRFTHCRVQFGCELGRLQTSARGELGVAIANVRLVADAANDPLANVAAQMQHDVSDRVLIVAVARPHLFGGQPPQAILDAPAQGQQLLGGILQESLLDHSTSSDQFSRIDFTLAVY